MEKAANRGGNWGGFSFEIETTLKPIDFRSKSLLVATGAASRLRLKHIRARNDSGQECPAVATGAASRLRLKRLYICDVQEMSRCGNWGGFSFEIETRALGTVAERLAERGNWGGFSFEIETSKLKRTSRIMRRGNWGGFSFEIETGEEALPSSPVQPRGNWGGFSFEIETRSPGYYTPGSRRRGNGGG